MRHLERTHGISIASLHEHFQRDHFILIYEITAKMKPVPGHLGISCVFGAFTMA